MLTETYNSQDVCLMEKYLLMAAHYMYSAQNLFFVGVTYRYFLFFVRCGADEQACILKRSHLFEVYDV